MKKSFKLISALLVLACAFMATSCLTTSGSSSSSSSSSSFSAPADTWCKTQLNYSKDGSSAVFDVYFIYSANGVSSGIRSDVTVGSGLTVLVTSTSDTMVSGISNSTFAVKSFSSVNSAAWSALYLKFFNDFEASKTTAAPAPLATGSSYSNVTSIATLDWKTLLGNYILSL